MRQVAEHDGQPLIVWANQLQGGKESGIFFVFFFFFFFKLWLLAPKRDGRWTNGSNGQDETQHHQRDAITWAAVAWTSLRRGGT